MRRALLLLLTATSSGACLSSASYGTARTLPEGKMMHGVGLEFWVLADKKDGAMGTPPWPSYTLRAGLADDLEIGGKVTYPRLGVDLKYNPIRTGRINVAGGVGVWVLGNHGRETNVPEPSVYTGLDLPILMDIVANDALVIVPTVGPALIWSPDAGDATIGLRTGLGTRIILNDNLGLHPEVDVLINPMRDGLAEVTFGFGVTFGPQPPPLDREIDTEIQIGANDEGEPEEAPQDEG